MRPFPRTGLVAGGLPADESVVHQTLAVRMLTLLLLVTATGIVATVYLGERGQAADKAALTNVRAAADAAEAWYQDPFGGRGSYKGLTPTRLAHEAPVVSPHVHVTVLAGGAAYCLHDVESSGHSAYYVGGHVGRVANLGGATPLEATLVHSKIPDASAVCANAS